MPRLLLLPCLTVLCAQAALSAGTTYLPVNPATPKEIAEALAAPVKVITDKPQASPTGDAHDYVSYARYWWPDPSKPNGLPYVVHDGHSNTKQVDLGDEPRIGQLDFAVYTLARGWSQTQDPACAQRAGEWLRAWFVTPATRMNPNLEYSQIQLGRNHNHGNNTGVLDGRGFAHVVDALLLLEGSPALSADDEAKVKAWFAEYSHWLQTAPNAIKEHNAPNNHGSWFLAQAIPIARYSGDVELAKALCEADKARIASQFKADGSQPEELRRADGMWYSFFNLQAQFQIAIQAKELGIDLWSYTAPGSGGLHGGFEYMRRYDRDPKSWPGNELKQYKPGFMDELVATGDAVWGAPSS